ncbi:hypothetical protein MVEG_05696 [Podila verticillata NRRL 6337]|nr:hypothetical protein MVEG_05696 [Podila verticillata NRRL 6337]
MSSLLNRASVRAASSVRFYRNSNIRTFNSATLSLPSTPASTSTHAHISEDSHSGGIATTALGRIGSYISDLIPSIVFAAVPKSKNVTFQEAHASGHQGPQGTKEYRPVPWMRPSQAHASPLHSLLQRHERSWPGIKRRC